jgi:hypothetical protein
VNPHRTPLKPGRGPEVGSGERDRLDVALRAADLDPRRLDDARRSLLARLSAHSNDFAATTALQALNTFSAGQRADEHSDAPAHLRDSGLSGIDRLRRSTRTGGSA